ncbi:MAG: ABC transporter permease [Moorellales bacterium]
MRGPVGWFLWPRLSGLVWTVCYRHLVVFKKNWKSNLMFNFVEPLLYLAAMGYGLGSYVRNLEGWSYLQFVAPGLVASSAMWATAAECTYDSFVRLHYQKVYEAIMATPVSVEELIAAEMVYGAFKSVLYGSVIILVLLALKLVLSPWVLLVPVVLALAGLIFAELSMIWTSFAPRIETFNYFFTLVITPMFLFGGVFFPVEGLPALVRSLSWFTPLYHSATLVRALVLGTVNATALWTHLLWLAVVAGLLFNPPVRLMRSRLVK